VATIGRLLLLGEESGAADVVKGYSIALVEQLLGDDYPNPSVYLTASFSSDTDHDS